LKESIGGIRYAATNRRWRCERFHFNFAIF
jgi:hypothetical protein